MSASDFGQEAPSMRRLFVALEQLLDPLGPAESGHSGREQTFVGRAKKAPHTRSRTGRKSLSERMATPFRWLHGRLAGATYELRHSQATGYRVLRFVVTTAVIVGVSCALSIGVLLLTTMRT